MTEVPRVGTLRATLSRSDPWVHVICDEGHHHAFSARALMPFRDQLDEAIDRRIQMGVQAAGDDRDHGDLDDGVLVTLVQKELRRYWPESDDPGQMVDFYDRSRAAAFAVVKALRRHANEPPA